MKISVVIPLYNKEKYIRETILSVLAQTERPDEIIVVNNKSTDKSLDKISDLPVTVITELAKGVSNARNSGIRFAKNNWIALLDADDLWHPKHLEKFSKCLDGNPSLTCAYSLYGFTDKKLGSSIFPEKIISFDDYLKDLSLGNVPITASSFIFNKLFYDDSNHFPQDLKYGEDQVAWINFTKDRYIGVTGFNSVMYRRIDSKSATTHPFGRDHLKFLKKLCTYSCDINSRHFEKYIQIIADGIAVNFAIHKKISLIYEVKKIRKIKLPVFLKILLILSLPFSEQIFSLHMKYKKWE